MLIFDHGDELQLSTVQYTIILPVTLYIRICMKGTSPPLYTVDQ